MSVRKAQQQQGTSLLCADRREVGETDQEATLPGWLSPREMPSSGRAGQRVRSSQGRQRKGQRGSEKRRTQPPHCPDLAEVRGVKKTMSGKEKEHKM